MSLKFGDLLLDFVHKLENCLPCEELISRFMEEGLVSRYDYYTLEAIPNTIKKRRDAVLLISVLPPEKIERFCYIIQETPTCKELGDELMKACQLQKHQLISDLKEELRKAKEKTSDMRVSELEKECAELRDQLQEQQSETMRWQLKCSELEIKLKELQAKCSSSIVKQLSKADSKDDCLGAGKFGIVCRVKHQEGCYAGKTIDSNLYGDDSNIVAKLTEVCSKFFRIRHHHVEAFKAIQNYAEAFVLLTDMFPENLDDFVKRSWDTLPYCEQLSLIQNMADGLCFLHQNHIIHSNLHGRNVLISHDRQAKISDYVCPQLQQDGLLHKATDVDDKSLAFVAPEISIEQPVHTFKSDVFSLGILFLQVLTQVIPSADGNLMNILDGCNPARLLVESCLSEDSTSRPDCVRVCNSVTHVRDSPQYVIYNCLYGKKELPSLLYSLKKKNGQIKWKHLTNLPVPMHSAYVVRLDDCLYVTGGVCSCEKVDLHTCSPVAGREEQCNVNASSCVFKFSLFHSTWNVLPLAKHKLAVPHIVCGKLVLFGGRDLSTNTITNQVSTYDTKSETLSYHYPNLRECRCFPAVVSWGDYVIVAGGRKRDGLLNDVEVLNTTEDHWTKLHVSLPRGMFSLSATVSNDILYLARTLGGFRPSTSQKAYSMPIKDVISQSQDNQPLTPNRSWNSLTDTPYINATIVPHAYPPIMVGGSDSQGNTVEDILCYDLESKSWKKVGSLFSKLAYTAVTTISSHAVVVLGGCSNSKTNECCKTSAMDTVQLGYVDESSLSE